MKSGKFVFLLCLISLFGFTQHTFAISNLENDASQVVGSSSDYLIQTLGTSLEGSLTQIDIQSSNPSFIYYGSRPYMMVYECNDDTYGITFDGSGCTNIYFGLSDTYSQISTSTQSFFISTTSPVIFNPSKYYFFRTQGNNQFLSLPIYYGSATSTVDGACYRYRLAAFNRISPCSGVADLYFNFYGISKVVPPELPLEPLPVAHSSVLFIPGFEGSRLYKSRGVTTCSFECEDTLWEPNGDSDVEVLFMNTDGTSVDSSIYTRDVLDEAYGILNTYKSFLTKLSEMKMDGEIADYTAVPYDWRLSLDDVLSSGNQDANGNISYLKATTTSYILQELERLVSTSQNGKVTIVTHSSGGLVAKVLLKKLQESGSPLLSKIDKLVLVAVPQLGTPSAITSLLHGYEQGITTSVGPFASAKVLRQLGQNTPSAYNFLPSEAYFEQVGTPVVIFNETMPEWIAKYGTTTTSVIDLHTFLADSYGRVASDSNDTDTPTFLNESLLTRAESLHTTLDNWMPPASLELVEIAGWGIPKTVSGVKYSIKTPRCLAVVCSMLSPSVVLEPTFTIDGDGTVVTPSALWANGYASTTRYWVDLRKWNNDHRLAIGPFKKDHPDILEPEPVITIISDVVKNTISTVPEYISISSPTNTTDRLIYSLHSPLTLDMYDSLGNHTGISTTTGQIEEQIPGTYFLQFGEIKYIFTDTDTPVTISMSGYDTGTFTFTIEQLRGDTTVSTVTFQDVPTTPATKVSMMVGDSINTLSDLNVDSNNDGISDITLTPVLNNVVTYTPDPEPIDGQSIPPIELVPTSALPTTPISSGGGPLLPNIDRNTHRKDTNSVSAITTTTATRTPTISIKAKSKTLQLIIKEQPEVEQTAQVMSANPSYISQFTKGITGFLKKAVNWSLSIFRKD